MSFNSGEKVDLDLGSWETRGFTPYDSLGDIRKDAPASLLRAKPGLCLVPVKRPSLGSAIKSKAVSILRMDEIHFAPPKKHCLR